MSAVSVPVPQGLFRRALRGWGARVGLALVLLLLGLAAFAPWVAPYDPFDQDLSAALTPPGGEHWFGADQYGRDVFSRVLHGTRYALFAILVADGLALALGGAMGLIAGFAGGALDAMIMRVVDVLLAFPYLLLALVIVAALGPSLVNSLIAIGIVYAPQYARMMRGQVLAVRGLDFVQAATSTGARPIRVVVRHVLPNCMGPVLVLATLQAGSVVVETAGLSFLGLGDPNVWSWGRILFEAQQAGAMSSAWWLTLFPSLAILLLVLSATLLSITYNDARNPKTRLVRRRRKARRA